MPRVGLPIPASRLPSPFRQRSTADLLRASSLATPLAFHPRPIEVVVYDLTSEHCCWEDLSSGRLGAGSGAKCRESRFPAQGRVRRSSQPPRFNDGRLPTAPTAAPIRRVLPRSTLLRLEVRPFVSFLPRSILVLPRSPVELPRAVRVLPRSGFALPRFAAVLGFAFPHLTGLFTPVAAKCRDARFLALRFMGVFTPVAPVGFW